MRLVPDNGIENGAAGWGSHSLSFAPGATASGPAPCISLLDPHLRAFARSNGADDALKVQVAFCGLTRNLLGVLNVADQHPGGFSTWQPTGDVSSVLAVTVATTSFCVRFTSLAAQGTWQVDDVLVDP